METRLEIVDDELYIIMRIDVDTYNEQLIMNKETFVELFNRWIKPETEMS